MLRRIAVIVAMVCASGTSVVAQTAVDTLTSSFTVDGIPVILRRNTSNNVVVANVYLLGGTRQVTEATSGIEPFLLTYPSGVPVIIQRRCFAAGHRRSEWTLSWSRASTGRCLGPTRSRVRWIQHGRSSQIV